MSEYEIIKLLIKIYEKPRYGENKPSLEADLTAKALRFYADYIKNLK